VDLTENSIESSSFQTHLSTVSISSVLLEINSKIWLSCPSSQVNRPLFYLRFHSYVPFSHIPQSHKYASLLTDKENNLGNLLFKSSESIQLSDQNITSLPFPTSKFKRSSNFPPQFVLESWVKFGNIGTMSFLIGERSMCLKCLQWFKSRFGLGFILSLVLGCFLFLIGVWIQWFMSLNFWCESLMLVLWSCLLGVYWEWERI